MSGLTLWIPEISSMWVKPNQQKQKYEEICAWEQMNNYHLGRAEVGSYQNKKNRSCIIQMFLPRV
jgi:hypothetical protein